MFTTRHSLMERVKNRGDQVAWQEFYDLYGPLIFRYGYQRGLNRDDAEEVVSECFGKLGELMSKFEYQPERGRFKSYLKRLVNNKITDMMTRRHAHAVSDSVIDQLGSTEDPNEAAWESAWRTEVLNHAVVRAKQEVSTRDFQIFKLLLFEGWTGDRIAEAYGLSSDQIYRIKYRVLQIVREKMAPYLEE